MLLPPTPLPHPPIQLPYKKHTWQACEIPRKIISNCSPLLASHLIIALLACLSTLQNLSTTYHLQTNGQTEYINQDGNNTYTYTYMSIPPSNKMLGTPGWTQPNVYNKQVHLAIGQTPFFLNYSHYPQLGELDFERGVNDTAAKSTSKSIKIREEAQASITLLGSTAKSTYKQNCHSACPYTEGSLVQPEILTKHQLHL